MNYMKRNEEQMDTEQNVIPVEKTTIEKITIVVKKIQEIDERINADQSRKAVLRQELEDLVGDEKSISIKDVAVIKVIPESRSISFVVKEVQTIIDALLNTPYAHYGIALSNAKEESIRKPSLRISKWKEEK